MSPLNPLSSLIPQKEVRVRFAPSPTGSLHIGGVRTALFNFAYARKNGGKFFLRIEDTDRERSEKRFEVEILESLAWLGLTAEEPFWRQSDRLAKYQAVVKTLLTSGCAYEEETDGRKAVKFRMRSGAIQFSDLVHGTVVFSGEELSDFVIQKSDGYPTYHLACVVDDCEMKITHVIRGDDHLSNTPRQIALYEALEHSPPQFAHLPLVLGQDKLPLSKRSGEVALLYYQREGYLPEAILNYLALLGWSPGENREIFSLSEFSSEFSFKRVQKTSACFDLEKLRWVNKEHIGRLPEDRYLKEIKKFFLPDSDSSREKWRNEIALLYRERVFVLSDLQKLADFFIQEQPTFDPEAVQKYLLDVEVLKRLNEWANVLDLESDFSSPQALETLLRQTAEKMKVKAADLIHPTRVAISGKAVTPSLFEVMFCLGKEMVVKRLRYAANHFSSKCKDEVGG